MGDKQPNVLRLQQVNFADVQALLAQCNLHINLVPINEPIPGSFWGDEEAGLIQDQLYVRPDTPIHSLLHESCHYICMDSERRQNLHTNAGGTPDEENAVCYLQVLLADELPFMGKETMMNDMDSWGYNFRLGSCKAWFTEDTKDEQQWLLNNKLINQDNSPTFQLRK